LKKTGGKWLNPTIWRVATEAAWKYSSVGFGEAKPRFFDDIGPAKALVAGFKA